MSSGTEESTLGDCKSRRREKPTATERRRTGTSNSLSLEPRAFTGKLILFCPIGRSRLVPEWMRRRYQGHHDLSAHLNLKFISRAHRFAHAPHTRVLPLPLVNFSHLVNSWVQGLFLRSAYLKLMQSSTSPPLKVYGNPAVRILIFDIVFDYHKMVWMIIRVFSLLSVEPLSMIFEPLFLQSLFWFWELNGIKIEYDLSTRLLKLDKNIDQCPRPESEYVESEDEMPRLLQNPQSK